MKNRPTVYAKDVGASFFCPKCNEHVTTDFTAVWCDVGHQCSCCGIEKDYYVTCPKCMHDVLVYP